MASEVIGILTNGKKIIKATGAVVAEDTSEILEAEGIRVIDEVIHYRLLTDADGTDKWASGKMTYSGQKVTLTFADPTEDSTATVVVIGY
jgi:SH3-like domain-containing protein